ncbi:Uncharacterised protein (plasmid) [Mycoplasmopsis cynos]|uniref:DNA methylase adenine-specific domain-containing protein n=1 Tax=Mycoplasmopsis cynos TaxID=171284 RepID=A0A449AGZ3_9BACT|nr:N-6 DNA methylase [Mycoplasmopsis cynos]VEU64286.1 Uncharacterised protein [Mycoplasmopsis cynos]
MHNIPPQLINIREADTLEDDWPTESNGDKKVKAIVANPPYSHLWKPDNKIMIQDSNHMVLLQNQKLIMPFYYIVYIPFR